MQLLGRGHQLAVGEFVRRYYFLGKASFLAVADSKQIAALFIQPLAREFGGLGALLDLLQLHIIFARSHLLGVVALPIERNGRHMPGRLFAFEVQHVSVVQPIRLVGALAVENVDRHAFKLPLAGLLAHR